MKQWQKIIYNPTLWLLVLFNAYFIYEYLLHPNQYNTIVWLFWVQSVLIGLFTFFELLTVPATDVSGMQLNGQLVKAGAGGCISFFFLVHYGGFHLGYAIFLLIQVGVSQINWMFFRLSLVILFANQLFTFIQHRQAYKTARPKLNHLFFMPYLRIVPMHLTLLLPQFLHLQPGVVFLVLKTVMDVAGYLIATRWQRGTNLHAVVV